MEGKIQVNNRDISITGVYVDGKQVDAIPEKETGNYFESASCDQDAIGSWDSENWEFLVNIKQKKTKCTLNFVTKASTGTQSGASKMEQLLDEESRTDDTLGQVIKDDFNNIRFIGANPNNYVEFNGELWRIIGLMDGVQTKDHGIQKLLKIIRNDSLGRYSWDSSASGVNNGYGVNEWSEADIQKVLNNNYLTRTTGGICYGGSKESKTTCPTWTTVGLDTTAQNMVEEVTWYTGTNPLLGSNIDLRDLILVPLQYQWERSNNHGKQCEVGNTYCNDGIDRKTTWVGKVGLMYSSDYLYATDGGGTKQQRIKCLYDRDSNIGWSSYSNDCKNNIWLYDLNNKIIEWTMTPESDSTDATDVQSIALDGYVSSNSAAGSYIVRPVIYLKSNVKINGGEGTHDLPYTLSVQ